jgi:hypothetical protein
MKHLFKIIEISHFSADNKLLWQEKNISNILHDQGKEFIIKTLFTGELAVPDNYYIGLDNRGSLSASQDMTSLSEPSGNGYTRQTLTSTGDFTYDEDNVNAVSNIFLTFTCTSSSYSAKNVFVTNASDNSGYLISSKALATARTLTTGETITLKIGINLS